MPSDKPTLYRLDLTVRRPLTQTGVNRPRNLKLAFGLTQINRGERIFIEGPSGSGKSTLLSLIAGVITPQKGSIRVDGRHVSKLKGADRDRFRADHREAFIQLLFQECDREETTLIFVSHDTSLENLFDRTIRLDDINSLADGMTIRI